MPASATRLPFRVISSCDPRGSPPAPPLSHGTRRPSRRAARAFREALRIRAPERREPIHDAASLVQPLRRFLLPRHVETASLVASHVRHAVTHEAGCWHFPPRLCHSRSEKQRAVSCTGAMSVAFALRALHDGERHCAVSCDCSWLRHTSVLFCPADQASVKRVPVALAAAPSTSPRLCCHLGAIRHPQILRRPCLSRAVRIGRMCHRRAIRMRLKFGRASLRPHRFTMWTGHDGACSRVPAFRWIRHGGGDRES